MEAERLYNAIMMYAFAINKTIENYDSITNGTAVIANMKGMKFTGETLIINPVRIRVVQRFLKRHGGALGTKVFFKIKK